jgi:hypothetical protein
MSTTVHGSFRRIVLRFDHYGPPAPLAQAAGEFARLLGLDLRGVFVLDETLLDLAALPFSRELRLPGYEWQPLERGRLADEFEQLARQARAAMEQAGRLLGHGIEFEIVRTGAAPCLCDPGDILALAEPPAGAAPAATGGPAPVLVLPGRGAAPAGGPAGRPVAVAVALTSGDQSALALAVQLARAAGARLVLLAPSDTVMDTLRDGAIALGMAAAWVSGHVLDDMGEASLARAARAVRARVLVAGREIATGNAEAAAGRLARSAGLPVLLV